MVKFMLGGIGFETKESLRTFLQVLAQRSGPVSAQWTPLLQELLKSHPRASQKGQAASFDVRVNLPWGTRGFWLTRHDGTSTDFSWVECLKHLAATVPRDADDEDMRAAARTAIIEQKHSARDRAFARASTITCPITGEAITRATCHVDHAKPNTFDEIYRMFKKERGMLPVIGHSDGDTEIRFADPADAQAFALFHAKLAKLQVVSRTANLSILRRK